MRCCRCFIPIHVLGKYYEADFSRRGKKCDEIYLTFVLFLDIYLKQENKTYISIISTLILSDFSYTLF